MFKTNLIKVKLFTKIENLLLFILRYLLNFIVFGR